MDNHGANSYYYPSVNPNATQSEIGTIARDLQLPHAPTLTGHQGGQLVPEEQVLYMPFLLDDNLEFLDEFHGPEPRVEDVLAILADHS